MSRPLRICVIGSSRFPVAEPFAGGLEAHTHGLVRGLQRRGHEVSLFARAGSDRALGVTELDVADFVASPVSLLDVNAPASDWMSDHHAYLSLMLDLARDGSARFDVVHNNSLHHLPVAMARAVPVPMVTTLHTPPLPWLESALALGTSASRFVAVSDHCAAAWSSVVASEVVHNGVDPGLWRFGDGGGHAVWTGRLVPEKAPHEAIDACRAAGVPLRLAGPVGDAEYYDRQVRPRLGDGAVHIGHLAHREVVELVRSAGVALVTPAWDEPYGLVAAEAMACGTPVAAYARGALPELVTPETGVLVAPGDVAGLAAGLLRARSLPRGPVRAAVLARFTVDRMIDAYDDLYRGLVAGRGQMAS